MSGLCEGEGFRGHRGQEGARGAESRGWVEAWSLRRELMMVWATFPYETSTSPGLRKPVFQFAYTCFVCGRPDDEHGFRDFLEHSKVPGIEETLACQGYITDQRWRKSRPATYTGNGVLINGGNDDPMDEEWDGCYMGVYA